MLAALNLRKREMPRFVWPFLISYLSTNKGAQKLIDYCLNNTVKLARMRPHVLNTSHDVAAAATDVGGGGSEEEDVTENV